MHLRFAPTVLVGVLAVACSSSSSEPAASLAPGCPGEGAVTCEGLRVQHCEKGPSGLAWSASAPCEEDGICKDGACRALTKEEASRVAGVVGLLEESRKVGATAKPVDYAALGTTLREHLLLGDGSAQHYARTLWEGMLAIPQGHQHLMPQGVASPTRLEAAGFAVGSLTRYSACLRPWGDHAVVTIADPKSVLKRGDEIVAIDGKRAEELKALLIARPLGMDYLPPTDAGRVAFALRSFFSVDREGTKLTVQREGKEIEVTLPKALPPNSGYGCDDAFGRDYTKPAIGTVLPDGTGVLYIPGFPQATIQDFESQIGPAFDQVKSAPRLVIDLRGNGGGLLGSALDIVSQLPGATTGPYCEFWERTPDTAPPSYFVRHVRAVDPAAVPQPPRFTYTGKVAVLIDGATHSAAEHFVLATKTKGHALFVGTKTAGGYGNISYDVERELAGPPSMALMINRSQVRKPDGTVMDGTSMEPDIEVGYDPASLVKGEDPMLARAVAELMK